MKRYVLTPSAKRDVDDIRDYIANDNIEAAGRVLNALESAMLKLAKNPGVGHWREKLADKRHRFLLVYSYPIVYRHEAKPLQIVRVLHAARDVQSILGLSPKMIQETPSIRLRLRNWTAPDARVRRACGVK